MGKALLMAVKVTVRERLGHEVTVTAHSGLPMRGSIPCMPPAAWVMAWLVLAMADVAGRVTGTKRKAALGNYFSVISRMVFVPMISRMSSRFTAVVRRWSSLPMTFSTMGSILSRRLSNAAQFGYSTRIRILKS
jgi:hypothetical protein